MLVRFNEDVEIIIQGIKYQFTTGDKDLAEHLVNILLNGDEPRNIEILDGIEEDEVEEEEDVEPEKKVVPKKVRKVRRKTKKDNK